MISDRTNDPDSKMDFLWIGFNSPTEWQKFLSEQQQFPQGGFLIGGVPVATTKNGLGFYFDPNTTTTADGAIPEIVTTLDALKVNPTATNHFSADWFVPATIEEIK